MPKMRTHSGTKKRIKRTATGKIKVSHSQRGHLLSHKNKSAKRDHAKANYMDASDYKRIKHQISKVK
jgi:large subunit ribosomal protein L35